MGNAFYVKKMYDKKMYDKKCTIVHKDLSILC